MSLQHRNRVDKPVEGGYAMVALLVSLGIMSVMMGVALPVWRQAAKREKEAELVWRGEQYARAIGLFQRKYGGAFPPNLDVLIEQKFLRRKFKDPMTEDGEFQVLLQTGQPNRPGQGSGAAARPGGAELPQSETAALPQSAQTPPGGSPGSGGALGPRGGVTGVTSKSKEKSIRLYKGRGVYNEWQFVYVATTTEGGTGAGGQQRPGRAPSAGAKPRPGEGTTPGSSPLTPGSKPGSMPPPMRPPR
jgi:type II secretory pathway pseudopilin PulG